MTTDFRPGPEPGCALFDGEAGCQRKIAAKIMAFCLGIFVQTANAEWVHDIAVTAVAIENVTLGQKPGDILADTQSQISYAPSGSWFARGSLRILVDPVLSYRKSKHYSDLDSVKLSLDVSAMVKFGVGSQASSFRGGVALAQENVRDDLRDGRDHAVFARFNQPVGERLDLSLFIRKSMSKKSQYAVPSSFGLARGLTTDVFDSKALARGFTAEYELNKWLFVLECTRRRGDVTAVTKPDRSILAQSFALARDGAFGEGWVAYRMDAQADTFRFLANLEVTRHWLIDLSFERIAADAGGGVRYRNKIMTLGFTHVL